MLLNFAKLGGLQLCGVTISWVEIFLGVNFPGRNYPGWEFFRWELSRCELSWVGISQMGIVWVEVILGGNFLGRDCPLGIIRVTIFWVGVFMLPFTCSISRQSRISCQFYVRKIRILLIFSWVNDFRKRYQ